jgi:hypothetical protein
MGNKAAHRNLPPPPSSFSRAKVLRNLGLLRSSGWVMSSSDRLKDAPRPFEGSIISPERSIRR